jgi:plastocyanin
MPISKSKVWFGALTFAFALSACGGGGGSSGGDGTTVGMDPSHKYDPEELTVDAGATVTWTSDTDEAHTVTAYDDGLPEGADYFATGDFPNEDAARDDVGEGLLTNGQSFEVTFDIPGTYRYFCIPHESDGMVGTIVVRP